MVEKISASVGKGGKNIRQDVLVVQMMLNRHAATAGYRKLKESGEFDKDTLNAIIEVQSAIGINAPDGRIEPGKRTFVALQARTLPSDSAKAAPKPGKLIGKTTGVQQDVLDFAGAVAAFYGRDIKVVSGKRDADEQAIAMFRNWTKTLKRGKIYKHLAANPKLLAELDQNYKDAVEDKTKTAKEAEEAKSSFLKTIVGIGNKISLHLVGKAIDVDPSCMTSAMREAMRSGLRELPEGKDGKSVYHYDTSEGSVPVVNDVLKRKWKAP